MSSDDNAFYAWIRGEKGYGIAEFGGHYLGEGIVIGRAVEGQDYDGGGSW